jgi:hypothetical protein
MLKNIIADYLQISVNNAQYLMILFAQEGGWQIQQSMCSQADVITYLHEFSQLHLFRGHDRSKLQDKHETHSSKDYFSLFEGIGLTQSLHYNVSANHPDFSVILGSCEGDLFSRVESLKQDLLAGYLPKEHLIFGLGSNRLLGSFVCDSEQCSKQRLQDQNQDQTEMNMVNLLTHECLDSLIAQDSHFSTLSYQAINTTSGNMSEHRVKTPETATSLKRAIESHPGFMTKQKPLYVVVYSNQPYILRQQRDIQSALGPDYIVTGIGAALTSANFDKNSKSINEFLGEIARLIYINYHPDYLKKFDIVLSAEQLEEIRLIYSDCSMS